MNKVFTGLKFQGAFQTGFIATILFLGILIRFQHLFFVGLATPFAKGGLFLEFAEQIYRNHFSLPYEINYYLSEPIPFLYPPLPFYIQAVLIYILRIPEFTVNNLLPVFFTIGNFLLMAKLLFSFSMNGFVRILGLAFFGFTLQFFFQTIKAGGFAESVGTFFLLLYFIQIRNFTQSNYTDKQSILTGVLLGLCILASPGSGLAAPVVTGLYLLLLLFTESGRRPLVIRAGLLIILFSFLVSSPYFYNAFVTHDTASLIRSLDNQLTKPTYLTRIFWDVFELINHGSIFSLDKIPYLALVLLGIVGLSRSKEYFLLISLVVFAFIPRENSWLFRVPEIFLVIAGAMYLLDQIKSHPKHWTLFAKGVLILSILPLISPTYEYLTMKPFLRFSPTKQDMQVLAYIRENVPMEEPFILLTNKDTMEVAPHVTKHLMLNGGWGSEFSQSELMLTPSDKELEACRTLTCIDIVRLNTDIDHGVVTFVWNATEQKIKNDGQYDVQQISRDYYLAKLPSPK